MIAAQWAGRFAIRRWQVQTHEALFSKRLWLPHLGTLERSRALSAHCVSSLQSPLYTVFAVDLVPVPFPQERHLLPRRAAKILFRNLGVAHGSPPISVLRLPRLWDTQAVGIEPYDISSSPQHTLTLSHCGRSEISPYFRYFPSSLYGSRKHLYHPDT
jgi:hypothetical protein